MSGKNEAAFRIEKDFLGEKRIPAEAYYGVQTQRGKDNFHITGTSMSLSMSLRHSISVY